MDTWVWIVILVAIVAIAALAWLLVRQRNATRLAERFGPEYARTVDELGGRRKAQAELERRQERVEALHIRPLSAEEQDRFSTAWRSVQSRFVDDPPAAIDRADDLVADVMQTRGYPVGDFEQRAADISVDHPVVVEHYRAAHAIAERNIDGNATTEDLRQAMVHYRALFEDLLETSVAMGQEHH